MSGPAAITAILVSETADLDAHAVDALLNQIAGRPARVTIACVASLPLISNWAPLTGVITAAELRDGSARRASEAARVSAALLPHDIAAQYWATRCWGDALRRASEHDILVVAGRPRRRRDRRLLATWERTHLDPHPSRLASPETVA